MFEILGKYNTVIDVWLLHIMNSWRHFWSGWSTVLSRQSWLYYSVLAILVKEFPKLNTESSHYVTVMASGYLVLICTFLLREYGWFFFSSFAIIIVDRLKLLEWRWMLFIKNLTKIWWLDDKIAYSNFVNTQQDHV